MPSFAYRAVDPDGRIVNGNLEANSERALETQLHQSGIELLRCVERGARRFGRKKAVTRKDLIGFCYHMEQMTRAGLPILEALTDLRDSVDNPTFREVIGNLISAVEVGNTLSQAMAD
jgi:type IV pilus assembly protein PilC